MDFLVKITQKRYYTRRTPIRPFSWPSPVLSAQEERDLVEWVIHTAEIGYVHTRQEMFESGTRALDKEGKVTILKSIAPARTRFTSSCDAIPSCPKELRSILGWREPSAPALKD